MKKVAAARAPVGWLVYLLATLAACGADPSLDTAAPDGASADDDADTDAMALPDADAARSPGDAGAPSRDATSETSVDVGDGATRDAVAFDAAATDAASRGDAAVMVDAARGDAGGRPALGAFWNGAAVIAPNVWYRTLAFVRPSTHTGSTIHAVAVYFGPGPAGTANFSIAVSGLHPCGTAYCTTSQWSARQTRAPVVALNGDFFGGINYATGVGTAHTTHQWRTASAGVLDPGNGAGSVLSTTGYRVLPSLTSAASVPTGTRNAVGGVPLSTSTMGTPSAGDYFAARTVSGTDDQGYLYLLVGAGFDHAQGVTGAGLTLHDAWTAITSMGAVRAINHDGGGSSQLVLRGRGQVYPAGTGRHCANHFGVVD